VKVIITGGAGFIGSNAAARHLARGHEVVVLDNLSRRGAERNWSWLQERPEGAPAAGALTLARADLRASEAVDAVFAAHADARWCCTSAGRWR
jgi:CDP-paratose 2-epimerase